MTKVAFKGSAAQVSKHSRGKGFNGADVFRDREMPLVTGCSREGRKWSEVRWPR